MAAEKDYPTSGVLPQHPAPHRRYVVKRGDLTVTATPCYGMHNPWWVVCTFEREVDPVPMQDGDEWTVIHARR